MKFLCNDSGFTTGMHKGSLAEGRRKKKSVKTFSNLEQWRFGAMKLIISLCLLICTVVLSGCQTVSRGTFGHFERSLNTTKYGYAIVEDFTGEASSKLIERFEVRPGDCSRGTGGWSDCANDRERSELSGPKNNYRGNEYWYGWSIYVPDDYPNVYPTKTALGQFHQENGPPAFMFQNYSGGYWIDRNFGSTSHEVLLISKEDFKGKWHKIEVNAKWHASNGFFVVYINGVEKWKFEGKTISEQAVFFKYGVYRSFLQRYKLANRVDEVPAQTVYFANVKRAKSRVALSQ